MTSIIAATRHRVGCEFPEQKRYSTTARPAGTDLVVCSRTFPAGAGHTYTWYGDGQLATETRPDGNLAAITYDTRGFPSVVNWSNNAVTPDVTLGFDNAGRLTSAGNTATTVTRTYDGSGRLGTESSQINWPGKRVEGTAMTLTYTYDQDSRPAAVAGPAAGRSTGYTYNQRRQFASVTHQEPGNGVVTFKNYAWSGAGRLGYSWHTIGGGITSNYGFDAAGQLTSVSHNASGPVFDSTAYTHDTHDTHDTRGRRTTLQRADGRGDGFTYDNASQPRRMACAETDCATVQPRSGEGAGRRQRNQINTAHYDAPNPTQGNTGATSHDDYNFDPMGNRTTVISSATGTAGYAVNSVNQYDAVAGLTHTHNANGAMTSDGSSAYARDSEPRRLEGAETDHAQHGPQGGWPVRRAKRQHRLLSTVPTGTINGRKALAYLYDAFHRRLGKAVINSGGTEKVIRYCYDQWNPILEIEHFSGTILETRPLVWGPDVSGSLQGAGGVGGLIARGHTPGAGGITAWHFHHYDGNGNVTSTTDAFGTVDATYRYDAFGNVLASSGSYAATNKYRFSTKPVDDECVIGGLAYYGYRYYHFALGRWGSRDPLFEWSSRNFVCFLRNRYGRVDFIGLTDLNDLPAVAPQNANVGDKKEPFVYEPPKTEQALGCDGPGDIGKIIEKEIESPCALVETRTIGIQRYKMNLAIGAGIWLPSHVLSHIEQFPVTYWIEGTEIRKITWKCKCIFDKFGTAQNRPQWKKDSEVVVTPCKKKAGGQQEQVNWLDLPDWFKTDAE